MTTTEPELHDDAAAEAISAELVRLTLGGRGPERLELRTDSVGRYLRALRLRVVHLPRLY